MSDAEPEKRPSLRPAQVTASTLAAVTSAFLASRIGVYGTIIGVGVVSLLSTLGSEVYLRSLERTKQAALARTALVRQRNGALLASAGYRRADNVSALGSARRGDATAHVRDSTTGGSADTAPLPSETGWPEETVELRGATADGVAETASLPGDTGWPEETVELRDATAEGVDETAPLPGDTGRPQDTADADTAVISDPAEPAPEDASSRSIRWPAVVVGSVAAFVLALLIITGIEAVTGSRLSGGQGSTLGTVLTPDPADPAPEESEDEQPEGPTPSPTAPPDPTDPSEPTAPPLEPTQPPAEQDTGEPPVEEDGPPGDDETAPPPVEDGDPGGEGS